MARPASVQQVLSVQHYTDRLFRFTMTRPEGLRFVSGQFIMLGLEIDGKPVMRAYSIASPGWAEELEFYSIKVPGGPLTSVLQHIKVGDEVLLAERPVGSLTTQSLSPGKRLFLFSTGTGIAPFASIIRDPETWASFDQVILTHTCREQAELAYGYDLVQATKEDPLVGEEASQGLVHFASVTREEGTIRGRVTDLIRSGDLFEHLKMTALDPAHDRAMICGSIEMTKEIAGILEEAGLEQANARNLGTYQLERAFVG